MVSTDQLHTAATVAVQSADQISPGSIMLVQILLGLVIVLAGGFIFMLQKVSVHVVKATNEKFDALIHSIDTNSEKTEKAILAIRTEIKELNAVMNDHHGRLIRVETELQHVERRRTQ